MKPTCVILLVLISFCNGQAQTVANDSTEKITQLNEVVVRGHRLTERKYGIKRRGAVHFSDGMFEKDEDFEIGQVVRLGKSRAQIVSVSLYISIDRADSATFRINFYRYNSDSEIPGNRLNTRAIQKKYPVRHGWLTVDLSSHNLFLRGDVFVGIEIVPNVEAKAKVLYDIKLGGNSKSFYRRNAAQQWMTPPHHYCLYVTALTDASAAPEEDEVDTAPTFTMNSNFSKEPFSIFVRMPRDYSDSSEPAPVVYVLDGNVYFDAVANVTDKYARKKRIRIDPIIVGLGYENAYLMDSLRDRDYTFPQAIASDSFPVSGMGDKYYNFIESKIKPFIDSVYRTDKFNQSIMGHSLGGYFVLYALSRSIEKPLFNKFVAASPSVSYHDRYIVQRLDSLLTKTSNATGINAIVTIGELERSSPTDVDFDQLVKVLRTGSLRVETMTYAKTEHMGTAVATFEQGILSLFGKTKRSGR